MHLAEAPWPERHLPLYEAERVQDVDLVARDRGREGEVEVGEVLGRTSFQQRHSVDVGGLTECTSQTNDPGT